jgi:hypothetical protein
LQYELTDFFTFHFQDEESLGREEEVEAAGLEEDLEVVGLEETSNGGGQDFEEEGHEDVAGLDDKGLGVMSLLQDPHPRTDLGVASSFALL